VRSDAVDAFDDGGLAADGAGTGVDDGGAVWRGVP